MEKFRDMIAVDDYVAIVAVSPYKSKSYFSPPPPILVCQADFISSLLRR